MSSIEIAHELLNPSHPVAETTPENIPAALEAVLAPVFAAAQDSASLIASRHPVEIRGQSAEIPKFLLLGARGGNTPIRLGLFAGFEAGNLATVQAVARLLLQLKPSPGLTRDYALIAYPVTNVRGFTADAAPLADFETRFANDSAEADVRYFKNQLQQWTFDGLISIRTDPQARGYYAAVRSEVIAREVVEPALAVAAGALPLATQSVKIRPGDRYARTADYAYGRLSPAPDVRPYPFEIELYVQRGGFQDEHQDGLFVAITEILRLYRTLIAHGQDL